MVSERYQTKNLYTVWFHLYVILEKAKLLGRDIDQWLTEVGNGAKRLTSKYKRKLFGVMKKFYNFILVLITWINIIVKNHRTVSPKRVNFNKCKLYLNKPNFTKMLN